MTLESKVPHMLKYLQEQGLKKKKSMGGLQESHLVLRRMTEVVILYRSCKKEERMCVFMGIKDKHELQNFAQM